MREEMKQGAFWPLGKKKDEGLGVESPQGVLKGRKAA